MHIFDIFFKVYVLLNNGKFCAKSLWKLYTNRTLLPGLQSFDVGAIFPLEMRNENHWIKLFLMRPFVIETSDLVCKLVGKLLSSPSAEKFNFSLPRSIKLSFGFVPSHVQKVWPVCWLNTFARGRPMWTNEHGCGRCKAMKSNYLLKPF